MALMHQDQSEFQHVVHDRHIFPIAAILHDFLDVDQSQRIEIIIAQKHEPNFG